MSRRTTIHELAETLAVCCADSTIADLMDATLSVADDERLHSYQVALAEALFDSLTELRPDCVPLAQERDKPKRGFMQWLLGV